MLAGSAFRPTKYDCKNDRSCTDGAYDVDDMSRHGVLLFSYVAVFYCAMRHVSSLNQINSPNCLRIGVVRR